EELAKALKVVDTEV
ncbi:hypothetical protein OSA64_02245, partial [Treponema pallidum]